MLSLSTPHTFTRCFHYEEYRLSFERSIEGDNFDPEDSFNGKFQRAENGLNFALSAFGSFLYFVGAFAFVPSFNELVIGLWIFIAGSAVIVMAQVRHSLCVYLFFTMC